MKENRNGIRQPQLANASLSMLSRHSRMIISDMKNPSVAVVWIQLVA